MTGIAIRSAGDLLTFMSVAGTDYALWNLVDLSQFRLEVEVTIHGTGRDGRADASSARLIQDLQRQVRHAFGDIGGIRTGGRRTMLRVAVSPGSDRFKIDFTEIGKEALRKMQPSQITRVLSLIAFLGTGWLSYSIYSKADVEKFLAEQITIRERQMGEHDERLLKIQADSTEKTLQSAKALVEAVAQEHAAKGEDPQKPIRKFVRSMRKKEAISVDGGPRLVKAQAIENLAPKPDVGAMYFVHADGPYSLLGVDLIEGAQGLRISQGDEHTTALLGRLDPKLKDEILATVDRSMSERKNVDMPLQVDVFFTALGIKHAVVIGVGQPRSGMRHFPLDDIPSGVSQRQRMLPGLGPTE